MGKKILILGAGFGGLEAATLFSEKLDSSYEQKIKYNYNDIKVESVNFVKSSINEIDTDNKILHTPGKSFSYNYLIVALGADLDHKAIPGFVESGGFEVYSLEEGKETGSCNQCF